MVDFGSQYSMLITRRLRELGTFSELVDSRHWQPTDQSTIAGVILSGGPDSTGEEGARELPHWLSLSSYPVLGICYGMQLLAKNFGASIRQSNLREFGGEEISLPKEGFDQILFAGCPKAFKVWMSHGDDVGTPGSEIETLAQSLSGAIAAFKIKNRQLYGLQFHPEVAHSEFGEKILSNFCNLICGLKKSWSGKSILESLRHEIATLVKSDEHVLMAVSGGVDSTVAAKLLVHTLGPDRVTAVFVDHGLLRKNEGHWVSQQFHQLGIKNFIALNREKEFLTALKGVEDPEQKRKIIGRLFVEAFEEYALENKGKFQFLGQGTLYPDVIESAGHGAGSKVIKSHHNVGGLPEKLSLKLCEPFKFLFKDEVVYLVEN